ncbi:plasma membrane fusion protein prm1 [Aulographum hederae CBS 113979]|uniref:Plasma membrane fusion protein PRM1 n=1 Tax=Aulographum hederae CBS 113979 TaxID=1176131 RepID=A0A6G1H7Y8_9PEZI|nr:plasma membrane fusion protein prm1 [Aulographum hederae CBS 113979]
MAFSETRQKNFPTLPPSLSAGDHEMQDYYAPQNAPRPPPNQAPYLTPYLGLRARLSQVAMNRWTILLLLVLVRLLFACWNLDDGLDSARTQALSACTSVEDLASQAASVPHLAATGFNEMTASGVEHAVNGLMSMVTLSVTGVEELVVFFIGLLTNTYLCLITLAVSGSLHAGIELVKSVQGFLNKTLDGIGDDIAAAGTEAQNTINTIMDGINGIPFVGGKAPKVDLTKGINELKDLKLPGNLNAELQKLNSSIPTFEEVKNFTDSVIRLPFEEIKKLVNQSMTTYTFDRSLLPVPQKEKLTFCSDNNGINDFFDGLVHTEHVALKIFLGVLITAAILVMIPMVFWEIKRWKSLRERAGIIGREAVDPIDGVYMASRPYSSQFGIWLGSKAGSERHRILIRWCIAYATSPKALFVLALALAAFFACFCQYLLLKAVEKQVPDLSAQVGAFAQKVVEATNNASTSWANGTNALIFAENKKINDDLFGWVNTSTTAVNDTLNTFVDKTTDVIQTAFGGTILEEPVQGVFDCLIGLKVAGIQKGLTWVHNNAHVNYPLIPTDLLSLKALANQTDSDSDDNFLANPNSEASDKVSDSIGSLIRKLEKGIRQEAIIATMILMVYLIYVLVGFLRAATLFVRHDKMRAEGGQDYSNGRSFSTADSAPPMYQYGNSDVNPNAPYTLNPHPFPRSAEPESPDEGPITTSDEKRSHVGVRELLNNITHPRQSHRSVHGAIYNEKSDPDSFAGGNRI